MLFVKIKSVSCHTKRIFRPGWIALRILVMSSFLVLVTACGSSAREPARFRALVFTRTTGYHHASIADGAAAIRKLGRAHGFGVDVSADASKFTSANLKRYAVVIFL